MFLIFSAYCCIFLYEFTLSNLLICGGFVKTATTVVASNTDESVNVYFDTDVTHRPNDTKNVIHTKAVTKMKNFLKRYNPEVLTELVSFKLVN